MSPIDFLRSLSTDELNFIASLDYGQDSARHFKALIQVIEQGGSVRRETEYWYPYEVIELGAGHLQEGHEREFTACVLMVLINIASGQDATRDQDEFIDDRLDAIVSLPPPLRALLEREI